MQRISAIADPNRVSRPAKHREFLLESRQFRAKRIAPAGQHSLDSFAQFILDLRILSRQIFSGNWRSSNILLCVFLYHIAYTFLLIYVLLFHLTFYI